MYSFEKWNIQMCKTIEVRLLPKYHEKYTKEQNEALI